MTYKYSEVNRLNEPCHYMYSQFEGYEFFNKYFENRITYIKQIQLQEKNTFHHKINIFFCSELINKLREFNNEIDLKERDYESIYAVAFK